MDSNNSRRSSCNFFLNKTEGEDGSLDYSADWNTFCFESELQTREKINNESLEVFEMFAQPSTVPVKVEEVLKKQQMGKSVYKELLKYNEDTVTKYNDLICTNRKLLRNIENLTAKNKALECSIKKHVKEEAALQEEYQQLKLVIQKGTEKYAHFGINVQTKSRSDTTYEALLQFEEKINILPVKFMVDRNKRRATGISMNGVLLPAEEEDITEKFGKLDNLPGLLCALHDIIIRK